MTLNCAARNNLESPDLLAELKGLTVGQKFILRCGGDFADFKAESAKFLNSQPVTTESKEAVDANEVPALSILQVIEKQDSQIELLVTSYRTGPHNLEEITLTDDSQLFTLTGLQWEVQTVVKQEDPQKPPEPFPAYPPWSLSYPLWMYGLILAGILILTLLPWFFVKRFKERKKAYDKIKDYQSVLMPLDAFYKEIRKAEKNFEFELAPENEILDAIRKEFKLFLTRALQVPAMEWESSLVLREIKKKHFRIHRDYANSISKLFKELDRPNIQRKDFPYFFEHTQKIVDSVDKVLSKNKPAGSRI